MAANHVGHLEIVGHGGDQGHRGASGVVAEHVEGVGDLGDAMGELPGPAAGNHPIRESQPGRLDDSGHAVDKEVGRDSARIVPIASPLEETARIPRALGGRPLPGGPVQIGPRIGVRVDIVGPEVVGVVSGVVDLGHDQFAQDSLPDIAAGDLVGFVRHALHPHLQFQLGAPHPSHHLLGLPDGLGQRLLQIDVLAGVQGVQSHTVVPVLGRGNQDVVQLLLGQKGPVVGVGRAAGQRGRGIQAFAEDVANCRHLDVGAVLHVQQGLHVRVAHAAASDDPDQKALIGPRDGQGASGVPGRGQGGAHPQLSEKTATIHSGVLHDVLPSWLIPKQFAGRRPGIQAVDRVAAPEGRSRRSRLPDNMSRLSRAEIPNRSSAAR